MIYIFKAMREAFKSLFAEVCKVEIKAQFACLICFFTWYYYLLGLR